MADLYEVLAATWPAEETCTKGPWLLRRSTGGGNRVTAASLVGNAGDLETAETTMRGWGQPLLFQVRDHQEDLDARLAARGYFARDHTVIMAGPSHELASGDLNETTIFCEAPLAGMAEIWLGGGIGRDRLAVMGRALGPKTWIMGREGDRPVAAGFVAIHDGVAMLHALEVLPTARRRGVGARVTRAAAAWAKMRNAGLLSLAVTEANAGARALYAGLGMEERARYHYRIQQD